MKKLVSSIVKVRLENAFFEVKTIVVNYKSYRYVSGLHIHNQTSLKLTRQIISWMLIEY